LFFTLPCQKKHMQNDILVSIGFRRIGCGNSEKHRQIGVFFVAIGKRGKTSASDFHVNWDKIRVFSYYCFRCMSHEGAKLWSITWLVVGPGGKWAFKFRVHRSNQGRALDFGWFLKLNPLSNHVWHCVSKVFLKEINFLF